ncbi:S8 family serine peptidase [Plantactinospora soyae]|uniref:Peptidase S8/S53 domain-containing protein n=1 Tax=Plantactinospora soyae TaxID=1544732 RepID=A0A927QWG4_9ACTN|nr:S8 family serine peptidase [Plantactinospora soyae]MBE1485522.1 hypothetical protein [Plantactinospora soyae]
MTSSRRPIALAVALGMLPPLLAPAVPAGAAARCATPAGVYRDAAGWAQRITDPSPIWPLSDGAGELLAVLGTGVDADNGQFRRGQVVAGSDTTDCDGRGTFAAGIVAAAPDPATTFNGMAPGTRILGLRYTQSTDGGASTDEPTPNALAEAIDRAVDARADVILVVVPTSRTSRALDSSVRDAVGRGVVVVSPAVADRPGTLSYPTSLPGVIGVGAHNQAGAPVQGEAGDHLWIAAPGEGLVSTAAGARGGIGQRWGVDDPTYAAAYVAGAAVLIHGYRPASTPAQIRDRLAATANRPPSGKRDPRLGWGVLDVRAAVTAELPGPTASGRPAEVAAPAVVVAAGPADPPARQRLPGILALLGLLGAVLSVLTVTVVRRGRARGWRP